MLKGLVLSIAIVVAGTLLVSCAGLTGSTPGSTGGASPTATQQQATSKAITNAASSMYNQSNVPGSMTSIAAFAKTQANVSSATSSPNSVTVTYKTGEKEMWVSEVNFNTSSLVKPSARPKPFNKQVDPKSLFSSSPRSTHSAGRSTANTALTINFCTNDTLHGDVGAPLQQTRNALAAAGYTGKSSAQPDAWGHDDFTLKSVKRWSGYSVVIMITHGYSDGTTTSIVTGEKVTAANRTNYDKWWKLGYVTPMTVLTESPGDSNASPETDWGFNKGLLTSDFFEQNGEGAGQPDYSGLIFFDGACDQLIVNDLADEFISLGADCVLGYDGPDTFSPWAFEALAEAMQAGSDSQTVLLQPWSPPLIQDPYTGCLIHSRGNAKALRQLANPPTITITSPAEGAFLPPNSTLNITGSITGYTSVNVGQMFPWAFLYGAGDKLTVDANGNYSLGFSLGFSPSPTTLYVLVMGDSGFAGQAIQLGNGN